MNAAIGKLLTQFDANGRAKSPPPPPPRVQDLLTRPKEVVREPQPQLQAQPPLPQSPPPAPKAEAPPTNLLDDAYRRGLVAGVAEGDAKLAEERVRSAIRLGEERAKWSGQQAVAIVSGFETTNHKNKTNNPTHHTQPQKNNKKTKKHTNKNTKKTKTQKSTKPTKTHTTTP